MSKLPLELFNDGSFGTRYVNATVLNMSGPKTVVFDYMSDRQRWFEEANKQFEYSDKHGLNTFWVCTNNFNV